MLFFSRIGGFTDSFRHFTCLAGTVTHATATIADHHEGGESEAATTFDHFGHTVDANELIDELVFFAITTIVFFFGYL